MPGKKISTFLNNRFCKGLLDAGGFSLIELILAMSILLIIIFAFTPLLLGSIERIYYSGDKGEALFQGQSELELKIAEKETIDGVQIDIIFENETGDDVLIEIKGGMVEVVKEHGSAESWLSTFVPFVPSINLYPSPYMLVEGFDKPLEIIVGGRDTDLYDEQDVKILDQADGEEVSSSKLSLINPQEHSITDETYSQFGMFELDNDLLNHEEPYIVEMSWFLDEDNQIEVTVRTRLRIMMPYGVIVGSSGKIYVSPDNETTWNESPHNVEDVALEIMYNYMFNDIIWAYSKYIGVTDNGKIMLWDNQHEPKLIDIPGYDGYAFSGALNGLEDGNGVLIAVGDKGAIFSSIDGGDSWSALKHELTEENLRSVHFNGSYFLTVGDKGTILKIGSNLELELLDIWDTIDPNINSINIQLYDVDHGHGIWVVVGERYVQSESASKAFIILGSDSNWESVYTGEGETALYDVLFNGEEFIAVGNNKGKLLHSSSGAAETWLSKDVGTSTALRKGAWYEADAEKYYIFVGGSNTLRTGTLDFTNTLPDKNTLSYSESVLPLDNSINLRSIAIAW